jgi:putative isomerase
MSGHEVTFLPSLLRQTVAFLMLIPALAGAQRMAYPDLLDLRTVIRDVRNVDRSFFSDRGAWHAYALPEDPADYGAFIGPLLMELSGTWLGNDVSRLRIFEAGSEILLSEAVASVHSYPGLLTQKFVIEDLTVGLELLFIDERTSMVQVSIRNAGPSEREIAVLWEGDVMFEADTMIAIGTTLSIPIEQGERHVAFEYAHANFRKLSVGENAFTVEYVPMRIPSNRSTSFSYTQSYSFTTDGTPRAPRQVDYHRAYTANAARWNGYLRKIFESMADEYSEESYRRLAAKSVITLITNWRSAARDLAHDGLFPSSSYQGFYGFWSWDSWKHAVALSMFHIPLAVSSVRSLFTLQGRDGMIPDCIFADSGDNNWRDTKPPLAAWAVWNIFQMSADTGFVREMYPKLVRYHDWWYTHRDHDKNGLCEYGSTDGTTIAAKWESGMDNAIRFDGISLVRSQEKAWSMRQESVDLNSYLVAEKDYLSSMASVIGKDQDVKLWRNQAERLRHRIREYFFDPKKGFFFDRRTNDGAFVDTPGPEGWIPLWTGIAHHDQASRAASVMTDTAVFNSFIPLPTISVSHPDFDPHKGYWRGPVWLDQFSFGVWGLRRYGYDEAAGSMIGKLFDRAEGLMGDGPIFENYHPRTGAGLNARNFSWSAAHLLLLLTHQEH